MTVTLTLTVTVTVTLTLTLTLTLTPTLTRCGDDATGARGFSAKAADCWALGVCLYMWLYLKPPFEAPTLYLLLEEIRQKDPPFDAAVVVSEGLMELLLGLLARKPTQVRA